MAGTKAGAIKARDTNYEKHGKDFYKNIGSKGGKAHGIKGFALMTPEKHAEASRKGGRISKRGKVIKNEK